jgi:hypothetical protein
MNNKLFFNRVKESTKQLILIQSTELYNPGSWLKDGTSPAEIILASAILVGAIAILVEAIASLLAVFNSSK